MQYVLKDGDVYPAKELINGMHYRQLGSSDLVVSEVCLGTMTWGEQNSEADAAEQLDLAYDFYGVNFVDTAEIYPVPTKAETQGRSEIALGKWIKARKNRENVVVATKVAGRSDNLAYIRDSGEGTRVRKKDVVEAVDKSLKRLDMDHIDLLQIHWPDRKVPLFGSNARYDPSDAREDDISFQEQLEALDHVVKQGKVRHIGVSNETPYGVTKMAQIGERLGLPRICSVQNNYSLLVRAEAELSGMPETCVKRNANVGFLAYSPLAGGVLTGKYQNPESMPADGRLNLFKGFMGRYRNSESERAVKKYMAIAEEFGVTPGMLALKYVYSRGWVTSTIVGATKTSHIRENLRSLNIPLDEKHYQQIQDVYLEFRDPTIPKRLEPVAK